MIPTTTSVRLDDSRGIEEPFEIPGGSMPVSVIRLRHEASRAFSLCVRFPAGWHRPATGHYTAAEDVVFLRGSLRIGDERFEALDWAHLPAGFVRGGMRADVETVAVARFGGPARWIQGRGDASPPSMRRNLREVSDPIQAPVGGGEAQLLRFGEPDSSWVIVSPPAAGAASPVEAQLVDLASKTWHHVPAGSPVPAVSTPALCWSFAP